MSLRSKSSAPAQRSRRGALAATALLMLSAVLASCSASDDAPEAGGDDQGSSVVDDLADAATSTQRVQAALAAGEIDEPTALLYGLWAQFGDRDLPERFRGAPEHHDVAGLTQLFDSLDTLPDEIRDEVEPFFKRPSDPDSAFSAKDGTSSVRNVAQGDPSDGNTRCSQDWISEAVPDQPFRVWACPDVGSGDAEAMIATVTEVLSATAGPMMVDGPDGMGPPIPDDPNAVAGQPSDDKIDVYVLPHGWLAPYRDLNERRMDERANGIAMRAAPRTGENSSGYVLVAQDLLEYPDALKGTLVHEIFHVLQFAHFAESDNSIGWVVEGSANWAENQFVQDRPYFRPDSLLTYLQNSELSLLDHEGSHEYTASLWFMFMEQEAGPEAVLGMWHALDSAPPGSGNGAMLEALESQIDVDAAFPEFVMRLLNADLPGDPVTPRFSDFFPSFPDDGPTGPSAQSMTGDSLTLDDLEIPGLGYRYARVALEDAREGGTSLLVTSDLVTPSGAVPPIEVLVESPGGDYERVSINPAGTEVCVASDLWLVMANTSTTLTDRASGTVELTRSDAADCASPPPETTTTTTTTATTTTTSPPTTQGDPSEAVAAPTGDFCTDMLEFQRNIDALADGSGLPVTAQRVAAIFALAEPYLADLPDGGRGQVEILRSHADQAADQSAAAASAVLANEEFQRNAESVSFLVGFC